MKPTLRNLLLIGSILFIALAARAQVGATTQAGVVASLPPPVTLGAQPAATNQYGVSGLFNTFTSWITTPDQNNLTLENTHWRAETGPALQSGVTLSDDLMLAYNPKLGGRFSVLSLTRNAGIAGTILAEEVGVGWNLYQRWDTEVVPWIGGGYRFDNSHLVGSIGVNLHHMVNKAAYVGIDPRLDFARKTQPVILIAAGVAF